MNTRHNLKRAASVCNHGGVIAYPTESIFGLGCNPHDFSAIEKLLHLKQRPIEKGLILIAANIEQLSPYIQATTENLKTIATVTSTPTTWLVTPSLYTPDWITGCHEKVAVRITQHPVAKQLCEQLNYPLVSTSANPGGKTPARTALKARIYFSDTVDFYLAGKTSGSKKASQIIDLETNEIIREG